jgi:hypothetical protein
LGGKHHMAPVLGKIDASPLRRSPEQKYSVLS